MTFNLWFDDRCEVADVDVLIREAVKENRE